MRFTLQRCYAFACACIAVALASAALAQSSTPHHDVVIKNAIVMTATHGNIKNGSVYVKDGKIAAVGENVNAPPTPPSSMLRANTSLPASSIRTPTSPSTTMSTKPPVPSRRR